MEAETLPPGEGQTGSHFFYQNMGPKHVRFTVPGGDSPTSIFGASGLAEASASVDRCLDGEPGGVELFH